MTSRLIHFAINCGFLFIAFHFALAAAGCLRYHHPSRFTILASRILALFWRRQRAYLADCLRDASTGHDDPREIRWLIQAGADPRQGEGLCPQIVRYQKRETYQVNGTALMFAAAAGNPAILRMLLPLSDPRARDGDGKTALITAVSYDYDSEYTAECVRLLLPVSDPDAQDKDGKTALMCALQFHDADAVRLLLPHSNLRLRDADGWPALRWAVAAARPDPEDPDPEWWQARALESLDAFAEYLSPEARALVMAKIGANLLPRWRALNDESALRDALPDSIQIADSTPRKNARRL